MKKVSVVLTVMMFFCQYLWAAGVFPDKDPDGLDMVGIKELGPNIFTVVRKDVFEALLTDKIKKKIKEIKEPGGISPLLIYRYFSAPNNSIHGKKLKSCAY